MLGTDYTIGCEEVTLSTPTSHEELWSRKLHVFNNLQAAGKTLLASRKFQYGE